MRTHRISPRILIALGALALAAVFAASSLLGGSASTPPSGTPSPGDTGIALASSGGADSTFGWPGDGSGSASTPGDSVTAGATGATSAPGSTATPRPGGPTPAGSSPAGSSPANPPPAGPTPTRAPTATPAPTTPPGGPCYVFPSSNVWHADISRLAVASNSTTMVNAIGRTAYLHPDFDAIGDGIPINYVTSSTPTYTPTFQYADESDPGPYPIPSSPRIEGGSDRHLIAVDVTQCKLWELYRVQKSGSTWTAGSGAYWDLRSNALRPAGWTSADAAGLPIFPGLVRYDEVMSGSIEHAIRFTAPDTCGYIYPARHLTAPACSSLPPMGMRFRLKASVNISGFGTNAQVVLRALKKYGMILADNGSPWYISGVPDTHWNDDEFHQLQTLHGSDFEAVDTSGLRNG